MMPDEEYSYDVIHMALVAGILVRVGRWNERTGEYLELDSPAKYPDTGELVGSDELEDMAVTVWIHSCTLCGWNEPHTSQWKEANDHLFEYHPEVKAMVVLSGRTVR